MELDIRWKQRFQNFDKAFKLLDSVVSKNEIEDLSVLECEGVIQRFVYTYELALKTLKDYLEYSGNFNVLEKTTRNVFKEAFKINIIKDEDVYINMMLSRNLLSHCYDFKKFKEVLVLIKANYLQALSELHNFFLERVV
jgi:nucleotidyltransferase substrate binding protein (TIGR01987 family)